MLQCSPIFNKKQTEVQHTESMEKNRWFSRAGLWTDSVPKSGCKSLPTLGLLHFTFGFVPCHHERTKFAMMYLAPCDSRFCKCLGMGVCPVLATCESETALLWWIKNICCFSKWPKAGSEDCVKQHAIFHRLWNSLSSWTWPCCFAPAYVLGGSPGHN